MSDGRFMAVLIAAVFMFLIVAALVAEYLGL